MYDQHYIPFRSRLTPQYTPPLLQLAAMTDMGEEIATASIVTRVDGFILLVRGY